MIEPKSWTRKVLVAFDQLMGVFLFNTPFEDETISSYVGRTYHGKWQEECIDAVFLKLTGKSNHCVNNIEQQFLGASYAS